MRQRNDAQTKTKEKDQADRLEAAKIEGRPKRQKQKSKRQNQKTKRQKPKPKRQQQNHQRRALEEEEDDEDAIFAVGLPYAPVTSMPCGSITAVTDQGHQLDMEAEAAVRCALCRLRASTSTRVSRGREIIPVVSSRRCCRRGHAQHLCPWPKPPQWAPAEAGEAPS
eukprot:scaffold1485_cov124-Isochrysis_galbana.AAC.1